MTHPERETRQNMPTDQASVVSDGPPTEPLDLPELAEPDNSPDPADPADHADPPSRANPADPADPADHADHAEPSSRADPPDGPGHPPAPAPAPAAPPPAASRRWPRRRFWVIGMVVLLCLALAATGFALSRGTPPGAAPEPGDHTVSGAIDGRDQAELHLVSGATVVTVRMESMGDTLYRVSTPTDGDSVPRTVERGGRVEVHLAPTGQSGPSSVEIVLSTEVHWSSLRFTGGANDHLTDLTGGRVGSVEYAAGAARIELALPAPEGTVPVRLAGGAGQVVVRAPVAVPVRATLHSGAGQVAIDGERHSGIAPGTEFTSTGWEQADDRYDIDAAGLGELTVTRDDA